MDFLISLGLFTSKSFILIALISFAFIFVITAIKQVKTEDNCLDEDNEKLVFSDLKQIYDDRKASIEDAIEEFDSSKDANEKKKDKKLKEKNSKIRIEELKKQKSLLIKKREDEGLFCPERVFVIEFTGDTHASEVSTLIKKINTILDVATDKDMVILNLNSPGGVVNTYGLCSSQLQRLRDKNVKLTVCIDNVAASGGYLMACVANTIVAAPFAYVGSIGVVAQIPNFNKVLKKHDVDYEQVTAGKYKRTLTMFGENTNEAREKFKNELELIHNNFKNVVSKYRPSINLDEVATGEFWLASDAQKLGLVDEIDTFDAYLQKTLAYTKVCAIKIVVKKKEKKSLLNRLSKFMSVKAWTSSVANEVENRVFNKDNNLRF
ncbi:MAG: protease SohB [Succinivibrio sp.]|uniref:Protease SohB n=1 Tax=Succinivibrio faecicola TaxID=2820300 RepID=A0ABS7DFT4_9GAMM|nr:MULTISPECIES: protease SohB [Succinivibrio]MBW7569401.1 protease SohB [Succinivibrio faecicola]MCI6938570.1 protease SohB [Succinatimonas hippei]MDD6206869.1 protease SohB [Succinivibrio sp.]